MIQHFQYYILDMKQLGITHYEKRETKYFMAKQSDDGYHILTKFKVRQLIFHGIFKILSQCLKNLIT